MSDGSRMKATVVSFTKKKGMSWGMADLRIVYDRLACISETLEYRPSYHLLRSNFSLLVLARDEGRACHDRWPNSSGRAESGPREGADEAGVHAGLSGACGSAHDCGDSIGGTELQGR
jgi:hypothetical protein